MPSDPVLTAAQRRFVADARRAVLATTDPSGQARLVPICFVLAADGAALLTPLDEKPKAAADPMALARVQDILARPRVSVLVDRWDEDWRRLGWVRLAGTAAIVEPGAPEHEAAVAALRAKYPPYADHALEARPIVGIALERASSWGDLEP